MGYSVNLTIDTGGVENHYVNSWNYTYNIAPMLHKAFNNPEGIRILDGMMAGECRDTLRQALRTMEDNPQDYLPLNPANGWGSYSGCLTWLRNILEGCVQHPRCILTIT